MQLRYVDEKELTCVCIALERRLFIVDCVALANLGCSGVFQIQQLLFAPCENRRKKETMPREREFDVPNTKQIIEPGKKKPLKNRKLTITGLHC